MRAIFLLASFWFVTNFAFADTIDHWTVYYNDSIIGRYNEVSTELLIPIKAATIRPGDSIRLQHFDDTPCYACTIFFFVRTESLRKLRITESIEWGEKLSFDLTDLITFGKKNDTKRYDFYYWEKEGDKSAMPMKLVFQMKLE